MPRFRHVFLLSFALASPVAHAFPWYASGENIWGADLMTPDERKTYVAKLQAQTMDTECRAFIAAHRADILSRAKAKGIALTPPDGNPCDVMKQFGRTH
jgi:hypothetical protein